jgi:hypothetical protein
MLLIEIDVVRSEPIEARVQRLPHVFGSSAASLALHLVPEFRGDDYFTTSRAQKPAEQPFTLPVRVHVGGVEEVYSYIECRIDYFSAAILVNPAAEVVATHSDDGNRE